MQNQIINGEKESAVTFFMMNEFIDRGPILWQEKFPLDGDLNDVLSRVIAKGKDGMVAIIDTFLNKGGIHGTPQDESKATYYKRRTPEMSEIKISDFKEYTAEQLYDKIRALQDPYPNAFIVCKNGTKLYLMKARVDGKK